MSAEAIDNPVQRLLTEEVHALGEVLRQIDGEPTVIILAVVVEEETYKVAAYHPKSLDAKEGWAFAGAVSAMLDKLA